MFWAAAVGGILKGVAGKKGADAQEEAAAEQQRIADDIAQRNADMMRMETEEELRRMDRTQTYKMSQNRASIANSGVEMEGSPQSALWAASNEYHRQRQWFSDVGEQRARNMEKSSEGASQGLQQQAYNSRLNAGANFLGGISQGIIGAYSAKGAS